MLGGCLEGWEGGNLACGGVWRWMGQDGVCIFTVVCHAVVLYLLGPPLGPPPVRASPDDGRGTAAGDRAAGPPGRAGDAGAPVIIMHNNR